MYNSNIVCGLGLILLGPAIACGGTVSHGPSDSTSGGGTSSGQTAGNSHVTPGSGGTISAAGGGPREPPSDGGVSTNAAGSPGANGLKPSSGCGLPLPAEQVATIPGSRTGYTEYWVNETGATLGEPRPEVAGPRQFFVRVPADYDPNRPYRIVYVASGCGGQQVGKTNTYPFFDEAQGGTEQAVYVALSIPDNMVNPGCYDNNTGPQSQEWEAFELIHTFVEGHYCVDNDRIFIGGYSTGGWLANMWGCYFGGIPVPERKFSPKWAVRGGMSVAGSLPPNQPVPCNGPAAHLWIHDALDKSSSAPTALAALDLALKTNGCVGNYTDGPKQPWAPAEGIAELAGGVCQEYTGCPPEIAKRYPLVFCTTLGSGHADQAVRAIPAFTRFVEQLDPAP